MDSIFVYRAPEACDPSAGPSDGRTLDGASAAGTAPTDAASTDARPAPEPPADLRVALQPNLSVRGWPTNAGSTALAGYSALEDATLARRLRESGARLCGYTGMSEFGLGLDGSSAGLVFLHQAADAELVLDLLGEGRLAAARAGVFGFKPSYGLLSRFGLVGLIPSMECCAVLAPNLSSIRRILEAIAGPDDLDYSLPSEELPRFSSPDRQISSQARPPISIGVVREATESLS
jgi:aspartyl-tRNA(Asn)/glutamyl-tRNA(Gln) amidotransferase subunit A